MITPSLPPSDDPSFQAGVKAALCSLVSLLPDIAWFKSEDGVYRACNAGFAVVMGKAAPDVVGKCDLELVGAEHAARFRNRDREAKDGPITYEQEVAISEHSGVFLLDIVKTPVRDANGSLLGILGTARDITAARAAEEALITSERAQREAQAAGHVGTYNWVLPRNLWTCSPELHEIFGIGPDYPHTLEGWAALLPSEERGEMLSYITAIVGGSELGFSREYRIQRACDGSERWVAGEGKLERDAGGRPLRLVGTVRDITESRRVLEDLRQAKNAAEAANEAKTAFLATMSHELRTPLNAIIGFSELLCQSESRPDRLEQLSIVCDAGKSLSRLIQDILDFSKIESGRVIVEDAEFDLRTELSGTLDLFRVEARRKGIGLDVTVAPALPRRIRGDKGLLRQVLVNLVGNALKFTARGQVALDVSPGSNQSQDGHDRGNGKPALPLLFRVTDTGIGIRPENQSRIFQTFVQEENVMTRRFGGSGLGLAISRRLVELMGGQIWMESVPGVGSRFSFTIEARPVDCGVVRTGEFMSSARVPAGLRLRQAHSGGQILIVEDDRFSRILLATVLTQDGYSVDVAENGQEAINKLVHGHVDLVMMDIRLPVLDGVEVTRRIRSGEIPGCPGDLPIIALTAYAMITDRERFLAAGMNAHVTKPIDVAGVLTVVAEVLKSRPRQAQTASAPPSAVAS